MASKKTQINNPLFETSEVDPTIDSNSSSSSDASYAGPMTRRRTKALAKVYAQTTSIPQPSLVLNTSKVQKSQTTSSTQGASKDIAGLIKEMLSQLALSLEPTQEAPIVDEEDGSLDGSEFFFSNDILASKLRDSPRSVSSFAMPVMTTNTTSLEEQVSTIAQTLEELMKSMKEREAMRDAQITLLMDKMGNTSSPNREDESSRPKQTHNDKPKSSSKDLNFSIEGSISPDQLKELIKEAIKDQVGGGSQASIAYTKPYTQRIDLLRMPQNYQPPKFQQFEGKSNPRQHAAHFVETCNNARTYGDLMVKQFVRSLKGNAFDWYTDLVPGSIDSWNQMEREFLNRFYSTAYC